MPLAGKLESQIARSGITVSELSLQATLRGIRRAAIRHLVTAATAETVSGVVRCNDLVTGRELLSSFSPPTIDTAINGQPTMTFGSGAAGINGQLLRPKRWGGLDLGAGGPWSVAMLIKAMNTGSTDVIISPERGATMVTANNSPFFRVAATGSLTLGMQYFDNATSLISTMNAVELYNTDRLVLFCQTPTVGLKWYVDNWSAAVVSSTTAAAKAALTDGRFVIGGYGPVFSSTGFAGSIAVMTFHTVDLSTDDIARRELMTALGAYGGITSN